MYSILLVVCSIGSPPEPVSTVLVITDERLQGTWQSVEIGVIGLPTEKTDSDMVFVVEGSRFTYRTKEKIISEGIIRVLSSAEPKMYELSTSSGPWRREIYQFSDNGNSLTCLMGPAEGQFSVKDKRRVWNRYSRMT